MHKQGNKVPYLNCKALADSCQMDFTIATPRG